MTGFGRAHGTVGPWQVDVSVRSVNHRFLDLNVHLREDFTSLEPAVRRAVSKDLRRGKVDVTLRLRRSTEAPREVQINESLLTALLTRLTDLGQRFPVSGRLEARDLLTVPDLVRVDGGPEAFGAEETEEIVAVVTRATGELVRMREAEGSLLAADLRERVDLLNVKLAAISSQREQIIHHLHRTLRQRLAVLFPETGLDPGRLEQEAAILAERSDIAEEITRLDAHLAQFLTHLGITGEPAGKKLDFLTQEIGREVNTLGAKSRDLSLARNVIEMKTEIEKIREQVQNLE